MNIGKFSYYCRKIHRWSLWFVVILGLIQMTTGLTMKYPNFFSFFNPSSARALHSQTATYFVIAFSIQMFTGLVMYITPWILRFRQ
ncbi:hypothetical protein A3A79_02450 [Candidatus Gottesmanbacteria bacterium RIFCSPLOWO2_01_FULL_43_11b]|uniref:Cytochrome b561 bacterial/Ni-hydrogenase domain-containing protein n=1 Tax=Candidatus Gottesmanbacteria bacterium RIFCSPLOWO2_01_FULL_43_11b TaxID=1798392 RepID=A0A1F6AI14_9BACT|nr:MAG: hypothetical protein A3A79_02450 [Candidatus Gottesmanbacteria bacterium RIFCSPLOWO2_01_FULL_43_11b]